MKFKLKKLSIALIVVLNIFSLSALPVYADLLGVALGNPISLLDTILGELGIDKNELKNTMNTVNVARRKINPPRVSLTFDPTDPVPGEKVTVTAMPTYFTNSTENLYFTWYIKSKRCYDKNLDGDDYKNKFKSGDFEKCDLNNSGEVNIEDYKVKATRILVNNDFVWETADYSSDGDDDGYEAVFGGDDQRYKNWHCFIHDVASGDDYEIECKNHLFPNSASDTTGDGSFGASEEKFWHTNPNNNDTASTGNTDEANVAGLGLNVISFPYTTGDKIGVAVEGVAIQPTQEADSSYRTMWAFTKNKCEAETSTSNSGYPKKTSDTIVTYPNKNATPGSIGVPPALYDDTDYSTTVTTTTVESIAPNTTQVNDNATIRTTTTIHTVVTYVGTDPDLLATNPVLDETTTQQTCSSLEQENGAICSGTDEFKSITMTSIDTSDLNNCLYQNLITPTEGGGATEKLDVSLKYLPENPINDMSENNNGDTLSFTASAPNATNLSYLNYTWEVYGSAEPNPDSWGTALSKDFLAAFDATQMTGLGINTFKFNLNFADANFVTNDNTNKKIPKYLKIKVIVKDTLVENGEREGHTDVVVPIFSSEERINIYTAKTNFDTSEEGDPIALIGLPAEDPLPERCLFTDPETESKAPLSICEIAKDELIALQVDNEDDKYSDFLWTIDGKAHICPDDNFSNCIDDAGKATERTYFPILKNPGDRYSVDLSMLDTKTGERLSLNRVFKVSVPEAKIVPKEKDDSAKYICRGLLLGNYIDFNGNSYEDRSDQKFQALTGNNLELVPTFYGTEAPKVFDEAADCPYKWNVDGININTENASTYGYKIDLENYGKLILPPKNDGETYLISFSAIFTPTNATKKVLNKYWDVTYNEFYEKKLTHDIEIEMVGTEIAQKANSPKKILATVSSGIPTYLAFLFRIVLSGMAIIFALKLIFFILPKRQF